MVLSTDSGRLRPARMAALPMSKTTSPCPAAYNVPSRSDCRRSSCELVMSVLAGQDGERSEDQDHQGVAQRVERAEQQRLPPVVLRARDVRDRGDVVPVDAVLEPEPQGRHQRSDPEALRAGGSEEAHQV
jgi:hypothetical protein